MFLLVKLDSYTLFECQECTQEQKVALRNPRERLHVKNVNFVKTITIRPPIYLSRQINAPSHTRQTPVMIYAFSIDPYHKVPLNAQSVRYPRQVLQSYFHKTFPSLSF